MQEQQEEKEYELLIQNQKRNQQPLQQPNQHLPSKQLKTNNQYQHFRLQLAKSHLQMSILTVALCIAGYIGTRFAISTLIPVGEMSSYASQLAGGFPPDFGVQICAIIFFSLLCLITLEKINPNIARKVREEYGRT